VWDSSVRLCTCPSLAAIDILHTCFVAGGGHFSGRERHGGVLARRRTLARPSAKGWLCPPAGTIKSAGRHDQSCPGTDRDIAGEWRGSVLLGMRGWPVEACSPLLKSAAAL
jgi:hypothetical protein